MSKKLCLVFLSLLAGCSSAPVYRTVDLSCGWLAPLEFSDEAIDAMNIHDTYILNSFNDTVAKNCGWSEK